MPVSRREDGNVFYFDSNNGSNRTVQWKENPAACAYFYGKPIYRGVMLTGTKDVHDLIGYDCIIVGSSVYAGMFRKKAKAFLSQNADVLRQKKLGLFVSGMSPVE